MPDVRVIFHRLAAKEYSSAREWYADRAIDAAEVVDNVAGRFSTIGWRGQHHGRARGY